MSAAVLLGVDWGTTNLRVMRIDATGAILEQRTDPRGAGGLARDAFEGVLREVAGTWLQEGLPVLVSGMAGARERWVEMPYCACPAGLEDIAAGLAAPPCGGDDLGKVRLVPGLSLAAAGALIDVMRGEETQILGALADDRDVLAVLPGTHSKWAVVHDGRITGFRTFMTGELFSAIRDGTVLGAGLGQAGGDETAFALGVRHSLNDPAITALLFEVRVARLDGRLSEGSLADYLSGLLIGAEIGAHADLDRAQPIVLVGTDALNRRYETALALAGFTSVRNIDGAAAVARGLWRINQVEIL